MESPATIREVVETALKNHPKQCIFREDTVDYCVKHVQKNEAPYWNRSNYIDCLEEALKECEIYCPHEGIDRRDNS